MPDPKTPIEETLSALNGAVIHGKVRELGASNVDLAYLRKSLAVISGNSFEEYKLIQNNYSFINRIDEKDLIPFCRLNEILYVGYGPLAGGVLSGKYSKGHDYPKNSRLHLRSDLYQSVLSEQMYSTAERLMTFARDIGIDLPTLMYAWLLEKGSADAFLIGPRSELQFRPLMHAMQLKLGEQEWLKLNKMLTVAK